MCPSGESRFVSNKPEELRRLTMSPNAFTTDRFFLAADEGWKEPQEQTSAAGDRVERNCRVTGTTARERWNER